MHFQDYSRREDAVRSLLGALDECEPVFARTRRKVEALYAARTPETPYYQFTVTEGFEYERGSWVRDRRDELLDRGLKQAIFRARTLPGFDFLPSFWTGCPDSGLIPRAFGVQFSPAAQGGLVNRTYLFEHYDEGEPPEIDILACPEVMEILDNSAFLVEQTRGRVPVAYPQMQGPLNNLGRFMPEMELLIGMKDDPERIERLTRTLWRQAIRIQQAVRERVGAEHIHARQRFDMPANVSGLIVEDYIAIVDPSDYEACCRSSWQDTHDALGDIFMHTCGPSAQLVETLARMPGLVAMESCFLFRQHKTTANIERMLERFNGRILFGSFDLPNGDPVEDMKNLTRAWLEKVSAGGRFMICSAGSVGEGKRLSQLLGRE